MSTEQQPEASVPLSGEDPYRLDPAGVREPPRGLRASAKFFGPGLIISASIVGSGELITATALGAEVGFILLWLVIFSTLVKVAVQVELARWAIATGGRPMEGFDRVPPRLGRFGWVFWMWMLLALAKLIQTGGVIGGLAAACSILLPIGSAPLEPMSLTIWAVLVAVAAAVTLVANKYALIERVAIFLTALFVLICLVIALGLPATEYAFTAGDLASGLSLQLPVGALGVALAMFGLTGVGSEEITAYSYWCLEKGYARWTGPDDGTPERRGRALGWIAVMQKDAIASWVLYTIGTMSFYIIGAAVLHPQDLVPEGNDMIVVLSNSYSSLLGEPGRILFLVGAIAALASTVWAAVPSWTRQWANALSLLRVYDWQDARKRLRVMRIFIVALPLVWMAAFLWIGEPFVMILVGGIAGGIFLAAVAVAAWYLRVTEVDPGLRGGRFAPIALGVSTVAIVGLGVYSVVNTVLEVTSGG